MEIIDDNSGNNRNKSESKTENVNPETTPYSSWGQKNESGKMVAGLIIAGIGCLFLAREMGMYIPHWLFSWKMLLIAIGIYTGVKNSFQGIGWLIPILIGFAFLLHDFMPFFNITHYMWPVGLILIGLYIIVKPRNNNYKKWNDFQNERNRETSTQQTSIGDEYLESSAVFGSIKKSVISKSFKGGEVNCVFGGGEINLIQADFTGIIQLELNAVFGGMRIIVPSNWEIKSELTAVLGSVEDKRPVHRNITSDSTKFLILKGTAVFGGIEILSY